MSRNILVVNPGSTSDEIAFFRGADMVFHEVVRYAPGDLKAFEKKKVTAQFHFRKELVLKTLTDHRVEPAEISAVIGRGGLVRPIPSGTYRVNEKMLQDLRHGVLGDHSSNLGGLIAYEIAHPLNIPAFLADPVVVDELEPLARYSGMPENPRISIFHALNQKRVARLAAEKLGKSYEDCRFIVMHGGGGISVGAHKGGRVVDVNNALDGDGPFTPQRSGGVPAGALARMCFSGSYSLADVKLKIKGRGGLGRLHRHLGHRGHQEVHPWRGRAREIRLGQPQSDARGGQGMPSGDGLPDRQGDRCLGRGPGGPGGCDRLDRRHRV